MESVAVLGAALIAAIASIYTSRLASRARDQSKRAAEISERHREETRNDHVDVRAKLDALAAENDRAHSTLFELVAKLADRMTDYERREGGG